MNTNGIFSHTICCQDMDMKIRLNCKNIGHRIQCIYIHVNLKLSTNTSLTKTKMNLIYLSI